MSPRQRWLLVALCSLAALVVVALTRQGGAVVGPAYELRRGRFVRAVRAYGVLVAARATPIVVPAESGRMQTLAFLAPDGVRVRRGDVVARFDDGAMRRELQDGRSDEQAAGLRLQRVLAESERDRASQVLDRDLVSQELAGARVLAPRDPAVFSRHEILASELDLEQLEARRQAYERKLRASQGLAVTRRALGQVERDRACLGLRSAERALGALEVRAPHDGLLVLERAWTGERVRVGQQVWPGERLAQIPDVTTLEARVHVLEADAAGLEPGRPARVLLEGTDGAALNARVARVDALAKARDRQSPARYFEASLSLQDAPADLKPGRSVDALLTLADLPDVLVVPRGALFERDGQRVVYVLDGARARACEVVVGHASASHVVITQGLEAGQRVLLRDPTRPADASQVPASAAPDTP
jgi:RND family efflux transporter MFP subunit